MEQTTPIQPINPQVNNQPKNNVLLFLLILFLMVITGLIAFSLGKSSNQDNIPPIQNQPTIAKSEITPSADITKDWKTYRNKEYGFEFKYPENLDIQETNNKILVWKDKNRPTTIPSIPYNSAVLFDFSVDNLNGKSFEQYVISKFSFPKDKPLTDFFDEMKWEYLWKKPDFWFYFHYNEGPGNGTYRNFIIGKNTVLNIVTYSNESVKDKQFDQVLSTFKFLP